MASSSSSDSAAAVLPSVRQRRRGARSERALVAGALAGDESDMEQLFRGHWPRAYRVALLIVHDHAAAEDIAQEAFVAAVRRLDRFDRRRPFAPWLMKIVSNRAIDWTRARGVRQEVGDDTAVAAAESEPAGVAAAGSPFSDELLAALAALPVEQRAVVVLRHLLEYTPGEIADALELPRGTVNSRLRRGLDTLAELLAERDAAAVRQEEAR